MKDLIKILTETYGPSGNEFRIRNTIVDIIRPYVDYINIDKLGNIIAKKSGPGQKIMFAAHMDEIGVIATDVDEKGFIRFSNVGGVSPFSMLGERVIFANGTIGVVGREKLDNMKDLKLSKMYIDIGAVSKEKALEKVKIGDMATTYRECNVIGNNVIAKALDNRAGCAVLINVLKNLKNPKYETFFVFTVQEEVGLRGAGTSAFQIAPDMAVAVDVTLTGDTPEAQKMAVELGKGPAVKVKDNSIICHPKVKEALILAANEKNIPYQMEVLESGGTDAGAIHLTQAGIPTGALSIPTRYVHTPSEMANLKDIENATELLLQLIKG